MAEDKVTNLYNTFVKNGYAMEPEAQFRENLKDPQKRKAAYEALVADGYDMEPFADFEGNIGFGSPTHTSPAPQQQAQPTATVAPTSTSAPAPPEGPVQAPIQAAPEQPAWQPSEQEKIRMSYQMHTMLNDFNQRSKERIAQVQRMTQPFTPEGRKKRKEMEAQAQLAGTPTKVLGLTPPSSAPASDGAQGEVEVTAQPQPVQSGQSPVPYGVKYIDGKPVTQWLLPDGRLTTSFIEADQAEYSARTARLRHQFENRMKQNGLDPAKPEDVELQAQFDAQAPAYDAVAELWQEAEEKHKADQERNANKHWNSYAALGGGREMRNVTTSMNRHDDDISHMTRFDIEKMMDNAWNRVGSKVTTNCYNRLRQQYPGASEEELQTIASQMARQLTDNAVYEYAVRQNTPKSTLEYFGRTVADMNVINSISKGLTRSQAGTSGDLAAYEAAMGEYGKNHRVAQIAGTVTGMAVDPVTWVSGGVGSFAGKGAINLGGRFIAGRAATSMSTQVGSRLFSSSLTGRIITGAAAGGGNFATYEMLKEGESQFLHGGHINPGTGENEGYSAGAVLSAGGHGLILGSVTGTLSPIIGNVADKTVKATTSTAGKAGARFGEVAVSTLAEGTVFSIPEWINGDADAMDVWTDNMAMMLGFKAQHGIKSAPRVIASLRPIKQIDGRPLTQAERNHNHMDFEERLRRNLDASPSDLSFTADEREELRRAGYGELADLFSRDRVQEASQPNPAEGAIELRAERVEAETISRNPEFDGYSSMEELMQDGNVSQSARAKAYYILTGRRLPMASVTGYTTNTDADGRVTVNSIAANGEVVTSRTFKNEQEAKQETDNIMRQAELNSVDVGERYKEAVADDMVLDAAISEVSPGDDPATIKRIYRAVKAGNKDVTESQKQLVEFLDDAIERNRDIADRYRPEAIREALKEETGIDVDAVLRKMPSKRTEAEPAVIKSYLERLFPEEVHQQAAEPTPEQAEAQSHYEQGRELYGRFEEGDQTVQADVDAIALRMQEAYQAVEDAFGAEAEYYMFHVNENPWALVNDPELTVEQQDAVLYYINAKAALDGVMDASNEAADRKRSEVVQSVGKRTHKDKGMVISATMKVNNRPVYVVKGDVVMFPDGSAIDVRNSSESVVVMDAQTGEYEFTSPDQIFQVYEAVNPQDELDTALSVIEQEQMNIFGDNAVAPEEPAESTEPHRAAEATSTANTTEYDRGYEQGLEEAAKADDTWIANHINILSQNTPESIPDTMKGELDAYLYEQQRRAQSVPETPESVPNPTEISASDTETAPETFPNVENGQQTALSRIPINERGEPMFEAVDKDTAWAGLVEAVGGETDAADIAMAQVQQARVDLEALKKKPPTLKAPKLKGSPMAMAQAKREAAEQYQRDLTQYNQQIADTQARLDAWTGIVGVYDSRNAELRRQREEERRQRDAIAHDEAVTRFEEEQRIKAEKQAEQERIGVHAVNPKIKEKWDAAPKVEGNEDALTLPDGSTVRGRYVLTEAGAASASHDVNNAYMPTEGFPIDENGQSVNDRDYMRDKDAQRIVEQMAGAYDNRALQTPVIVSKDGVVLSGNNRTMSGDLAARQGTDKAYVDYLREFGHKYGFSQEQVQGMTNPRLVFVPKDDLPYDATTFSRFNAQEMKSQSKPEAAVKLGKIVPDNVFTDIVNDICRYDRLSDYYADEKAVAHALGALMQAGVINDKQMPGMRTGTALSAAGKELIENTLIGKVFQTSPDAVRQIISMPALRQGIVMGLHEIANNRTLARNGYDISEELAQAVDLVTRAKTAMPDVYTDGMPVSPFGRIQGLFDDEFGESRVTDGITLLLADILNSGKPSDLRKVLTSYNNEASQASGGQIDIFSGSIPTKEEILTNVNEHFRNATPKEQQALVDAAIAERKRRAEADAEQRERSEASEQTPHDDERRAEPQQPASVADEELTPEEQALAARIEVTDNDWTEGEGDVPTYKRDIIIDGTHKATQVDAPDEDGHYTGSYFEFDGKRFGDIAEIAQYIDGHSSVELKVDGGMQAEPTEAQKAAGNYKMEHRRVDGYNISIENAKGSVRRGTGADGKPWETVMQNDYGYIRGTEGVDGDHIDVFLSDTPEEGDVFVVDQVNEGGSFDEHKVMYGFPTEQAARDAYLSNYEPGWTGLGAITHVSKDEFKKWIQSSRRKTKPFAGYKSVKAIEGNGMIGRSLTEQEATELIERMEVSAEVAPTIELTPENWITQFGEDGTIETPIGTVKMGENQYFKIARQGREGKLGMVKPTLQNPNVVVEDYRPATVGISERDTSYIFVKTFSKEDGSRYYYFTSVTVRKEGREVVISNQERSDKRISKLLQQGKVAWIDNGILHPKAQIGKSVSLNDSSNPTNSDNGIAKLGINSSANTELSPSSERYLTEAPNESGGPDLVPTSDNIVKGKEREDGQLLILPSESSEEAGALSSPTLDSPTDRKVNTLSADKQAESTESSLQSKATQSITEPYTITATTYTNKKGKTSDVHLVKFNRELTAEEKAALDTFAREPLTEGKKTSRGWYDRKQGGYMMRSEEVARQLAEVIGNEEAVADAQPMTAEELREAVAPAEKKPARKPKKAPINRVSLEDVMTDLSTKGETKLSDHAEPVKSEPEQQHEISDDEMQSLADELRDRVNAGEWDAGLEKARTYLDAYESSTEAKEARVADLSQRANTPVRIVRTQEEADALPTPRERRAKGWWSAKDDEIVIVLPNNVNVADVDNTFVHEVVGHKGLRALVGEERFDEFLGEIYTHASNTIRKVIDKMTDRMVSEEADRLRVRKAQAHERAGEDVNANYYTDMAKARVEAEKKREEFRMEATEEYMSDLGGRIGSEGFEKMSRDELTLWGKIKAKVQAFLDKFLQGLKIAKSIRLTDKDLAYILFKSWKNLRERQGKGGVFAEAEDAVMRRRTGWDDVMLSDFTKVEDANIRFNRELQQQIDGTLPNGHIYQLGNPGRILRSTGVPNLPIQMSAARLRVKATEYGHDFDLAEIRNLVKELQTPMAVFAYGNKGKMQNIIVGIESNGKQFIVGLSLNPIVNGKALEINSVRNVFPKNNAEWLNWISQGKLLYADKQKIQALIDKQRTILADVAYLDLEDVAKVIKTFENPTFDGDEDVRFRDGADYVERVPVMARAMYEKQIQSSMYQFTEAMQDSMRGLMEFYKAVESQGAKRDIENVSSFENAYIAENLMSSKSHAEMDEYEHRIMRPLLDIAARMSANKRGREALIDYMMAKHGLERNAYMRNEAIANGEESERDFAGLCGLTGEQDWQDAETAAQQIVNDYEAAYSADIAEFWSAVNKATKTSLKKVYDCGLVSKEQYEKIRDMYDYYIPLRGFDEKTSDDVYGYLTSKGGAFSSPIKKAEGRKSKADDPLATIAYMAQNSIIQGNRNVMKQKFLTYVQNHPSDLASVNRLWLVHDETMDTWKPVFADVDENMTPDEIDTAVKKFEQHMEALSQYEPDKYKRGRDAIGIPYRMADGNIKEHQVLVKRNGESYVITINGNPRAAQAVNGLTNPDNDLNGAVGKVFNIASTVNRWLAQVYTTLNPDFSVANFIRDLIYSNTMVHVKENKGYAMKFHKNHAKVNPIHMVRLLHLYDINRLDMHNPIHRMFYEFMHWGGETGYTMQRDLDREKKLVAQLMKEARRGKLHPASVLNLISNKLDQVNRGVENSARFAAFVTSRESGRDVQRSVYDAKEISVNFNKKGAGSKFMDAKGQTIVGKTAGFTSGLGRSFYVFWNAAVQGTANYAKTFRKHPGKSIMATTALVLLGYVMAALLDDDDDENKNSYYNVPKYTRRSNLMFRSGEQWITIPLPVEYRALYGLGELAYSVTSGREEYSDAELAKETASQLSQLMPLDFMEGGGGLHAFVPSAFKPLVESATNTSWTGLPIYKDTPFNKDMPEWTKAYPRANAQLIDLSKWANEASGGNDYKAGWANFNPAQLEYLLNGYFGGYSNVLNKMVKTGETLFGEREYDPNNILLVNRIVKMGDERTAEKKLNSDFFQYLEEYKRTHTLLRKYEDEADRGVDKYRIFLDALKHSRDGVRHDVMDEYMADYNWLNKAIKDPDITDEERMSYEDEMRRLKRYVVSMVKVAHDSVQVNKIREQFIEEYTQQ